jgi:PAS domain-containing protein
VVLAPDGTTLYANRVALDHTGLTVGEVNEEGFFTRVFHPDDIDRVREERIYQLLNRVAFSRSLKNGGRPSVSALLVSLVEKHRKELEKELGG